MPNGQNINPIETISNQPEKINDFIGNPPGWILRSGITIVAIVVIIGIALSYIISYPDKITSPVIITTENPPVDLVSKTSGKIEQIFVNDKDTVSKGQKLFYIENTANPAHINYVEEFFIDYEKISFIPDYLNLRFNDKLITGELNNTVSSFSQKFKQFQNLLKQSTVFQKLKSIDNEVKRIKKLNKIQGKQIEIYDSEVKIKEKDYNRNITLHDQKVISDSEIEKIEAEFLTYKRQLENMKSGIVNNKIRIEQLQTQKLELTSQRQEQVQSYINELSELKSIIKNQIKSWREKYYIVPPINGIITIPSSITKGIFINQGSQVCTIIPSTKASTKNKKIALAITPITGVGKIEKGSKTIIQFDAYPYKEFGTLTSTIDDISLLPVKDNEGKAFYNLAINLPDTLKTNYNKIIPYRPNMSGVALIITKDKTVFERIFEKFLDLVKNE